MSFPKCRQLCDEMSHLAIFGTRFSENCGWIATTKVRLFFSRFNLVLKFSETICFEQGFHFASFSCFQTNDSKFLNSFVLRKCSEFPILSNHFHGEDQRERERGGKEKEREREKKKERKTTKENRQSYSLQSWTNVWNKTKGKVKPELSFVTQIARNSHFRFLLDQKREPWNCLCWGLCLHRHECSTFHRMCVKTPALIAASWQWIKSYKTNIKEMGSNILPALKSGKMKRAFIHSLHFRKPNSSCSVWIE